MNAIINPNPLMLADKIRLAKAVPLWVPQETPGKEETTGFIPTPQSSWVAGLKYTPERGSEMTVKKGGKNYAYPGLNLAMFKRWVAAKSPGKWWWRNVGYPLKNSRWTGPVHPLFGEGVDGPVQATPFSKVKENEALDFLRKYVSPHATSAHLAALAGWLPGTSTNMSAILHGNSPKQLHLITNSADPSKYDAHTTIFGSDSGHPLVYNDQTGVSPDEANPYRGVSGAKILRQIRAAYELGIPKLGFHAALGKGYVGGLHWPMMGADGYLPEEYLKGVPPQIVHDVDARTNGTFTSGPENFRKISDFFRSPLAKEYYADNPTDHEGFIDTTPGSYSRKAIERHVAENSLRHGHAQPIPDEQMPKLPLHFARVRRYHPMTEHLIATGSLHPDYFDQYFEN